MRTEDSDLSLSAPRPHRGLREAKVSVASRVALILPSTHFSSLHQGSFSGINKALLAVVKLEINVHMGPRQEKIKSTLNYRTEASIFCRHKAQ